MAVEANPRRAAADWIAGLRVVESHNEEIVRTSIRFDYEPFDHPKLKALRRRYELDRVVDGAENELDLIARLARWSSARWERGHLDERYPPWDALEILEAHADGTPVGGFCLQHNLVFLQACESFGLPGRVVSIGPGNLTDTIRGGHEVVEIWSSELGKWIYVDGNTAWYLVDEATREPLSLWELRRRQLETLRDRPARLFLNRGMKGRDPVFEDVSRQAGLESLTCKAPHVEIRDFDNDGWMDLYTPIIVEADGRFHPVRHAD